LRRRVRRDLDPAGSDRLPGEQVVDLFGRRRLVEHHHTLRLGGNRAQAECGNRHDGRDGLGVRRGPLVVPEVNADRADEHNGIVANPNCSTIQLACVLEPPRRAAGRSKSARRSSNPVLGFWAYAVAATMTSALQSSSNRLIRARASGSS